MRQFPIILLVVHYLTVKCNLDRKSLSGTSRRISDEKRPYCSDDVYFAHLFKFRVFSFEEAINALRETMHPTMFNEPDAPVHAYVELDMTTDKKVWF